MESMSPIVDCGVHYVDVMCQMTGARPVRVSAIGARLTDELKPGMYNYGQLQVTFDDGSVGWYEAGWGPMMSEVAFFVKDVIGPKGCVSIVKDPNETTRQRLGRHRQPHEDQLHPAASQPTSTRSNEFVKPDELINTEDEPDHQGLCDREQAYLLRAIQRGPGPVGPHARRGQQPAHRARRRRERAHGPDRHARFSRGGCETVRALVVGRGLSTPPVARPDAPQD